MSPRRVVILRHAEKPENVFDPDLSAAGEQRAAMLATRIPELFPKPDFLFAAASSKHSDRPVETLTPLSRAIDLPIDDSLSDEDYPVLANDLLAKPRYAGRLAIVCWHHGHIPDLALALGVSEAALATAPELTGLRWNAGVFDRFWALDFQSGAVAFQSLSQN
jgi:hypothetical protein